MPDARVTQRAIDLLDATLRRDLRQIRVESSGVNRSSTSCGPLIDAPQRSLTQAGEQLELRASCQVVEATADVAVGYWSSLATAVWMKTTHPHHAASLRAAIVGAQASSPSRKVWLLQIVTPEAIVPDTRSRSALAGMLCSVDGIVSHSAVIHVGSGFRASIVRSIVTGLNALGRQQFPHCVFASLEEGVAWLATHGLPDREAAHRDLSAFHDAAVAGQLTSVRT
ncbi:hypothetical protein [Sorangium sp. So ce693]|uniref:hypothetical protein n=1 Tax=Sorangium sp. So ce693 TaxID=3133318 RepID=UPI003F633EE8